jgi:hypothetical protein
MKGGCPMGGILKYFAACALMWCLVIGGFITVFKKTVRVMKRKEYFETLNHSALQRNASATDRDQIYAQAMLPAKK